MSWRNLLLEAVRRALKFICHREQSLDLSEFGGVLRHLTAARRVLAKGPMVIGHRLHNGPCQLQVATADSGNELPPERFRIFLALKADHGRPTFRVEQDEGASVKAKPLRNALLNELVTRQAA